MSKINWNRLLSLIIAVTYLVIAYVYGGGELLFRTFIYLALPMTAIWYGEELGSYMGTMRLHQVTAQTPGIIVVIGGWILLLLPVVAGIYIAAGI